MSASNAAGTSGATAIGFPARVGLRSQAWRSPQFWTRPAVLLGVVAAIHGLLPLLLLGPNWGFGADETVYLSQLNAHVPPGLYTAPRARGTTFVAAPVTLLVNSVTAVRLWLAVLTAICVFLGFRPWLRLRMGRTVPLAAALFCSIWSVTYYGFEAMPNEWLALAVLAGTGYVVLFLREGDRRHLVAVVVSIALAALFRPSDAGFAAVGLAAGCVLLAAPRARRVAALLAVVVGLVLGLAQWVIEAYTSFGGLQDRIQVAQAEQGGGGLRFSGWAQARSLGGPLLCRTDCHVHAALWLWLWWVAAVVLIGLAIVLARGRLRGEPVVLAVLVGVTSGAQYFLTVDYAAPRFLIPTYALLSLPCAYALLQLRQRFTGRAQAVFGGLLVAVLALHVVTQGSVIVNRVKPVAAATTFLERTDAAGLRALGVRGPCVVLGKEVSQVLTYYAGCSNMPTRVRDVRRVNAAGADIAWIGLNPPPPVYQLTWVARTLPLPFNGTTTVYLSLPDR